MWDPNAYPAKISSSMTPEEALRANVDAILNCALKVKETVNAEGKVAKAYVVGKTKSYFRAGALEYLEANRKSGLDSQAITIQRFARGWLVRKQVGIIDFADPAQALGGSLPWDDGADGDAQAGGDA